MKKYFPDQFEQKWVEKWEKDKIYEAPELKKGDTKFYSLYSFPYPSGAGLHVGHVEGMVANDIAARFARMNGKKTFLPMGWDSFGLPAENYAIKTGIHPKDSTDAVVETFREQIKKIGIGVDWRSEVGAHWPEYYKWTQWIFLQLYKHGLAYQKEAPVNWCPKCQTSLANEQVVDGKCERCDTVVEQRNMKQWFFKITEFAERLNSDLDKVDWPNSTKDQQRNWIGKSQGINITYNLVDIDGTITCFTTRPDTNFGATFIVVAPESAFVQEYLNKFPNKEAAEKYIEEVKNRTEFDRLSNTKEKTGVFTGLYAHNNLNDKKLPIYIGDFVLARVGTGCVVGVPGHDMRDYEFATAMGVEVVRVVVGPDGDTSPITKAEQIQEEAGTMINSGFLNGMDIMAAKDKIMDYLEEKGWGKRITNYRLRDWLVSRQRYWGAPIPIVYDPDGNPHPVAEDDLPVLLPYNVDFKPTGESPLKFSKEFHESAEKKYGKGWRREVDTMDTFVDSSWYYFRHLCAHDVSEIFDGKKVDAWLPTDLYMIGAEHIVLHLLYSRFFTKFFFDQKKIHFDEPFYTMRHMGTILGPDGRKMSKRWGNVINPTDVVNEYGADTLRLYEMFMGPLSQSKPWNTRNVQGAYRFVKRVWDLYTGGESITDNMAEESKNIVIKLNQMIEKVTSDTPELRFNTAIAAMMTFINEWEGKGKLSKENAKKFLQIIAPYAPFITEELWQNYLGEKESIHTSVWPKVDKSQTVEAEISIPVQVNGKMRGIIRVASNNTGKDHIVEVSLSDEKIKPHIEGKKFDVIYVPGKILNFVVKG